MAIQATYVDDDDHPEELVRTSTGYQGLRYWLVNTRTRERALIAPGLPDFGTPWSVNIPELRVSRYENPVDVAGLLDANGEGGHCWVPVVYTTGEVLPGDKWTEIGGSIESFQRYFAVGATPNTPPISNGEGTSVEVGLVVYTVVALYKPTETETLANLVERCTVLKYLQALNDDTVVLPALRHTGGIMTITHGWGQLRYHDFAINTEANIVEVRHTIKAAPDHLFRWMPEKADGTAAASTPIEEDVYEERSFSGLW